MRCQDIKQNKAVGDEQNRDVYGFRKKLQGIRLQCSYTILPGSKMKGKMEIKEAFLDFH